MIGGSAIGASGSLCSAVFRWMTKLMTEVASSRGRYERADRICSKSELDGGRRVGSRESEKESRVDCLIDVGAWGKSVDRCDWKGLPL